MEENKNYKALQQVEEKQIDARSGWLFLGLLLLLAAAAVAVCVVGGVLDYTYLIPVSVAVFFLAAVVILSGLKVIDPNEALVLVLFGKYIGTVTKAGFYFVNPFAQKRKMSVKARTLNNDKQKVNDEDGNPIEIGVVVIWRVMDTALALFGVEDYEDFVSTQTDAAIRQVSRMYPYDVSSSNNNEITLRASSQEVAEVLQKELAERVKIAGIEIMDTRISHLAYATEIAAAMLQRQQAAAIIAARQMIVDGAVGMVEMALKKIAENDIVKLSEEKKAEMVGNLLVVLCGDKAATPVINT